MLQLDKNCIVLDEKEIIEEVSFVPFDLNCEYKKTNFALKIDFKNNFNYSIFCIKKLLEYEKENIQFSTSYKNYNLKYIIKNYSPEILDALKAISIHDEKQKITFLYNCIVNSLDNIWYTQNPCKFCNNICIASRNGYTSHKEDGCCYSFEYSKNPLLFIKNLQACKQLGKDKKCLTQNISCKLFVCDYLKKIKKFKININSFLLIQAFFSKKQQLVLQYNFFKTKEEIIEKLLENDNSNFLIYYLLSKYRI